MQTIVNNIYNIYNIIYIYYIIYIIIFAIPQNLLLFVCSFVRLFGCSEGVFCLFLNKVDSILPL